MKKVESKFCEFREYEFNIELFKYCDNGNEENKIIEFLDLEWSWLKKDNSINDCLFKMEYKQRSILRRLRNKWNFVSCLY